MSENDQAAIERGTDLWQRNQIAKLAKQNARLKKQIANTKKKEKSKRKVIK